MTNKRSRAQMGDLEGVHKSRQINLEGPQSNPHKRPRHTWSSDAKPNSVNPLKKKIRDVSRLLNRSESLPAGARMDNERALASYKLELADAMDEQRRQKMIKKYHMVRFFERQKATRQLKQLRKQLASSASSTSSALEERIHEAEVDLNYALHCPLDQKYISLYKSKDEKNGKRGSPNDQERLEKPPLWKEVETRMVNGTLQELRNSRSKAVEPPTKTKLIPTKYNNDSAEGARTSKKSHPKERSIWKEKGSPSPDNASDGGFFDE